MEKNTMAEDVARAVQAESPDPFTIAGKEIKPRGLTLKELAEVERDCLNRYRRQYLESYRDNLDLLTPEQRDRVMLEKIEETARWDLTNLPPKFAVDWQKVRLSPKLREFVDQYLETQDEGVTLPEEEAAVNRFYKKLVGAFVDQGMLSDAEYKQMTGSDSPKTKVPYISWWITGSLDGQISMVWMCCGGQVTRAEIESDPLVLKNRGRLLEIAQSIETLSAPDLGNG
jgi:hypothetical protein